ncbi:hypothetical protein IMCC1989_528 [gamma proteobacterium IMCC1989]|nr:hypothetical protein IMCC1989_528 [gamma proteobacterium IMCC1989]
MGYLYAGSYTSPTREILHPAVARKATVFVLTYPTKRYFPLIIDLLTGITFAASGYPLHVIYKRNHGT